MSKDIEIIQEAKTKPEIPCITLFFPSSKLNLSPITQKWALQTASISLTWELIKNAEPESLPQTYSIRIGIFKEILKCLTFEKTLSKAPLRCFYAQENTRHCQAPECLLPFKVRERAEPQGTHSQVCPKWTTSWLMHRRSVSKKVRAPSQTINTKETRISQIPSECSLLLADITPTRLVNKFGDWIEEFFAAIFQLTMAVFLI